MTKDMNLEQFLQAVTDRKALGDNDPERGHAEIDYLIAYALRAVVGGKPDAQQMAIAAVMLLDTEETNGWVRWYS
ncbi:hypothetical protein [Glaciihabitans sp. UYNi722]|uniref:hypothetical protein n=1 Tax=Glaciihabitans sp. UYNi722 TaxID=3156344 RepID=UPI0033928082